MPQLWFIILNQHLPQNGKLSESCWSEEQGLVKQDLMRPKSLGSVTTTFHDFKILSFSFSRELNRGFDQDDHPHQR